jgi:hypothetical protein
MKINVLRGGQITDLAVRDQQEDPRLIEAFDLVYFNAIHVIVSQCDDNICTVSSKLSHS